MSLLLIKTNDVHDFNSHFFFVNLRPSSLKLIDFLAQFPINFNLGHSMTLHLAKNDASSSGY